MKARVRLDHNLATEDVYMSKVEETLQAQIAALMAANAKLKEEADKAAKARLSMRVGDKGGISLYGLGRFPVTLYAEQWETLLGMAGDIKAFIVEQKALGTLQTPEQKVAAQAAAKVARAAKVAADKVAPSI